MINKILYHLAFLTVCYALNIIIGPLDSGHLILFYMIAKEFDVFLSDNTPTLRNDNAQ